ncbi:MAG: phosphatase PAP2 family protein [Sphingomonas sp.]
MRRILMPLLVAAALTSPLAGQMPAATAVMPASPALLLPPPPKPGSPEARAEIAELQRLDRTRSAAELAHARADGKTKNVTIFAAAMGPGFDLARLPATKALFDTVRFEEKGAVDQAKHFFHRPRPWIVDPALHPCPGSVAPDTSYPSGHSTMGFTMAGILARLAPGKAQAILARAADYAQGRLTCGRHFRSDIVAGQALGTLIAARLMERPAFRAQFAAAQRELGDAGLLQ